MAYSSARFGCRQDQASMSKCQSGYRAEIRFTIMDHDVLKIYNGVRNVIMRIRAKNPPSGKRIDKDAVLLNSHIDSTLPAPGAAE